jgi:hypothetical protein
MVRIPYTYTIIIPISNKTVSPLLYSYLTIMFSGKSGMLNRETSSTSLFFERVRKWNGLLIEANPSNYELLKSKQRRAFTVNACLSTSPLPSKIS